MPNRRLTRKTIKGKDGVHPGSRKADQLQRVSLREHKLKGAAKARRELASGKLFRPVFFLHALSSSQALSLPSLKALIAEVFITRNDPRIEELTAERRAGRPKTTEHLELEELRRREQTEFETGFEVPDLTDPKVTTFMWNWLERDVSIDRSHVDMLRQVRVFKDSDDIVVSKPGRLKGVLADNVEGAEAEDWTKLTKNDGTPAGEEKDKEMEVEA